MLTSEDAAVAYAKFSRVVEEYTASDPAMAIPFLLWVNGADSRDLVNVKARNAFEAEAAAAMVTIRVYSKQQHLSEQAKALYRFASGIDHQIAGDVFRSVSIVELGIVLEVCLACIMRPQLPQTKGVQ